MFTLLATQRKRREIDPVIRTLQQCRDELAADTSHAPEEKPRARQRFRRVEDLLDFLTLMEQLAERFFTSHRGLRTAVKLLAQSSREEH
jgi:hypothetical protein